MNSTFTKGVLALSISLPFYIAFIMELPSMGLLPIAIGLTYTISKRLGLAMISTMPIIMIANNNLIGYWNVLNTEFHFPILFAISLTYSGLFTMMYLDIKLVRKIILPLVNKRLPRRYAL